MIIALIIGYSLIILGISWYYRKHTTGDEYLMGDRKTSAIFVAAALFTLIGGGELVTLTALSFTYGYAGLSLFIGYTLGFCLLAFLSKRIRKNNAEKLNLSLPDYVHEHYGFLAGQIVFYISFAAFFSLLIIQFTAGGQVISSLTSLTYEQSVLISALVCAGYLLIGGFKTALLTDFIQGIARILLFPIIVFVAAKGFSSIDVARASVESLPQSIWISLIITGFFSAASSADVWQRIYVAKSDKSAKIGLLSGGMLLLVFGVFLVFLGLIAKNSGVITSPDTAFTQVLSTLLPPWAVVLSIVLVVSIIMSTADTEIFLLSGMSLREIIRYKGIKDLKIIKEKQTVLGTRILMIVITACAILLSLKFTELIPIYTWLLASLLIIAPMVLSSLFLPNNKIAAQLSLILNLIIFTVLVCLNILTPENAYYIVIPGLVVYLITYLVTRKANNS